MCCLLVLADPKALQEKLLKSAVEGGIKMLLQLLDHLVNADQLLASPQAASLLVTPIPGAKASKPSTAADLVTSIQVQHFCRTLSRACKSAMILNLCHCHAL